MESKWFAIMMIGIIVASVVGISMGGWNDRQIAIESAKAGLEQCPNLNSKNSTNTIWIKSCKEYTDAYYTGKQGE